MTADEDYERFDYYISDAIERIRDNEGWSDAKIAYWLRDKAKDLAPRKKSKKAAITKKVLLRMLEKLKTVREQNAARAAGTKE